MLAFAGLLWSTLRDGTEYYKHVDEVMANPQAWEGKQLQLHGYVVPGSILQQPDTLEYRFKVQNNPARDGRAGQRRRRVVHRHRARHVQGRRRGRAAGQADADGFHTRPERRDGEVPVEVRSRPKRPAGS